MQKFLTSKRKGKDAKEIIVHLPQRVKNKLKLRFVRHYEKKAKVETVNVFRVFALKKICSLVFIRLQIVLPLS